MRAPPSPLIKMFTVVQSDGTRHRVKLEGWLSNIFSVTGISVTNQMLFKDGQEIHLPLNDGDVIHLVPKNVEDNFRSAINMDNVKAVKLLIEAGECSTRNTFVFRNTVVYSETVAEILLSVFHPFNFQGSVTSYTRLIFKVMFEALALNTLMKRVNQLGDVEILIERGSKAMATRIIRSADKDVRSVGVLLPIFNPALNELAELTDL